VRQQSSSRASSRRPGVIKPSSVIKQSSVIKTVLLALREFR
jgi:hypothetical protein